MDLNCGLFSCKINLYNHVIVRTPDWNIFSNQLLLASITKAVCITNGWLMENIIHILHIFIDTSVRKPHLTHPSSLFLYLNLIVTWFHPFLNILHIFLSSSHTTIVLYVFHKPLSSVYPHDFLITLSSPWTQHPLLRKWVCTMQAMLLLKTRVS